MGTISSLGKNTQQWRRTAGGRNTLFHPCAQKATGKKNDIGRGETREIYKKTAEGGRKKVTPAQPHGGVFAKWSCKWAENSHFSCAPSRPIRPIPARRRSSAPATSSRLSSFALAPECYRGVTLLRAVVGFGCSEVLVCDVPSARRRPSRSGVTAESRSCVRMSGSSVPFRLACLVGEGRDSRLPLLCIWVKTRRGGTTLPRQYSKPIYFSALMVELYTGLSSFYEIFNPWEMN